MPGLAWELGPPSMHPCSPRPAVHGDWRGRIDSAGCRRLALSPVSHVCYRLPLPGFREGTSSPKIRLQRRPSMADNNSVFAICAVEVSIRRSDCILGQGLRRWRPTRKRPAARISLSVASRSIPRNTPSDGPQAAPHRGVLRKRDGAPRPTWEPIKHADFRTFPCFRRSTPCRCRADGSGQGEPANLPRPRRVSDRRARFVVFGIRA